MKHANETQNPYMNAATNCFCNAIRRLSMAESKNPAIVAALQRRYSELWRKNLQHRPIFTIAARPKTAMLAGMAPQFDNTGVRPNIKI